jgi:sugar phosphate isomerase/epimerase
VKLAASPKPTLKNRFPFRVGTTSYIYPDEILTNVVILCDKIEDIEIVLYESDEISNYPTKREIEELAAIGKSSGLTYTVHLPLDIRLGDSDQQIRQRSVDKCIRAISSTALLAPSAYIVHFQDLPPDHLQAWLENLDLSVQQILDQGVAPRVLCVETLDYPFHQVEGLLQRRDLSICLDVGHIILYNQPLEHYLQRYLPRCRVIHLHGIRGGRDHRDLGEFPTEALSLLFSHLAGTAHSRELVVTLEIFSERDLETSLAVLEKFWP